MLPEPIGRFKMDCRHPLTMLKELIGPDLYSKCCRIIIFFIMISFLGGFLYLIGPNIAAIVIVG